VWKFGRHPISDRWD